MNKKNITIDTEFFDDGIEAKLKTYHPDSQQSNDLKKQESFVEHYRRASYDNNIPNSRYEHVPDNQYSTTYEAYEMSAQSIQKLQAANNFEILISRVMANLFVRCWEEMKGKLPQYSHLVEEQKPVRINDEVLQDYNNIFNNNSGQKDQEIQIQNGNVFSKNNEILEERKNEIIERQKKGFTLNSLSKEKLNRSKSTKKEDVKLKQRQNIENERGPISRKSYRQKFLEYKHRSRSKDLEIQKSLGYPKFYSQVPLEKTTHMSSLNHEGSYSSMNLIRNRPYNINQTSAIMSRKNQILHNIHDLLMGRQEIYEGQKCNYYINHRDSSKNMFLSQANSYHPKISYNLSTQLDTYQNEQDEFLRTKLIEEIVDKLQYSKLRLEEIQKPKGDEEQILKRIDKLEKIILQLKKQQNNYQNRSQQPQIIHHKFEDREKNKSQDLEIYKKIIDEIAQLRSDVREIRTIKFTEPKEIIQNKNPQNDLIFQQQKLLNLYQQEFQKIVSEKEKTNAIIFQQQEEKTETAKKSILDQLIENGKNNERSVTWNDGWSTNQKIVQNKRFEQNSNKKNNLVGQTVRESRRTQHLNNEDGFQRYRYTRNQILQSIGLKAQIQEEQQLFREEQARLQINKERREEEAKIMVENVRRQRKQENKIKNIDQSKLTRDMYEKQWKKYQKTRIDFQQNPNPFCALFPC